MLSGFTKKLQPIYKHILERPSLIYIKLNAYKFSVLVFTQIANVYLQKTRFNAIRVVVLIFISYSRILLANAPFSSCNT